MTTFVQVFFPAVDKAWKTKVLNIVSQNGPQSGLTTRFDSLPRDQVVLRLRNSLSLMLTYEYLVIRCTPLLTIIILTAVSPSEACLVYPQLSSFGFSGRESLVDKCLCCIRFIVFLLVSADLFLFS